jgi:hypothetical protein
VLCVNEHIMGISVYVRNYITDLYPHQRQNLPLVPMNSVRKLRVLTWAEYCNNNRTSAIKKNPFTESLLLWNRPWTWLGLNYYYYYHYFNLSSIWDNLVSRQTNYGISEIKRIIMKKTFQRLNLLHVVLGPRFLLPYCFISHTSR